MTNFQKNMAKFWKQILIITLKKQLQKCVYNQHGYCSNFHNVPNRSNYKMRCVREGCPYFKSLEMIESITNNKKQK